MAEDKELQQMQDETASVCNTDSAEFLPEDFGFTGSYIHGLDGKGRMIIPASFRKELGEKFVVCPSEDCKHIALYPTANWMKRRDQYVAMCAKMRSIRPIFDFFTQFSYVQCEMDSQGRLLLPGALRSHYLKDSKEVLVSGAYDCIVLRDSEESRLSIEQFHLDHPDVLALVDEAQKLL